MAHVSTVNLHTDVGGNLYMNAQITQITRTDFVPRNGQHILSIRNQHAIPFQLTMAIRNLHSHKEKIAIYQSILPFLYKFRRSKNFTLCTLNFTNLPLEKHTLEQKPCIAVANGMLTLKITLTRELLNNVVAKQDSSETSLSTQIDKLLLQIEEKNKRFEEQQSSFECIKNRKGIYNTRSPYKNCESCLNLLSHNICSVHKIKVTDHNICSRFYPYSVSLGGGFSPK